MEDTISLSKWNDKRLKKMGNGFSQTTYTEKPKSQPQMTQMKNSEKFTQ